MTIIFFKAALAGFLLAVPLGPVNLLCIQLTLARGRHLGMSSGFGAATADAIYGIVAALGLNIVTSFILREEPILRLLGGILLCIMGVRVFVLMPQQSPDLCCHKGQRNAYVSALLMTLANPLTIFAFLAVFATFGISRHHSAMFITPLIGIAVFAGSLLWWLTLTRIVTLLRNKCNPQIIRRIHEASGLLILMFGIITLLIRL